MTRIPMRTMALAASCVWIAGGVASAQAPDDGPDPMPSARYEVDTTKNVMVPMRDGIRLATDIYRPKGVSDKLPVVLIRLPYNKDTYRGATVPAQFFASQGYVVLTQDVRGRWHSEGTYAVEMPDANDGYDAVDWASKQPWSTGKVGTFGCSYLGEVQYELLTRHHPAHLAAIPQAASGAVGPAGGYFANFGTYSPGGAMTLSSLVGWFATAGTKVKGAHAPDSLDYGTLLRFLPTSHIDRQGSFPPTDYEDFVTHKPSNKYWLQMAYLSDSDRFDTPTLQVNSWGDVTPEQTLYAFNLMRRNSLSGRARDNQFVIMSPTTHCASERATAHAKVGSFDVGDARLPYWQIYLDWFDHWLKGVDNHVEKRPKVQYYEIGAGAWRTAESWPVPGLKKVLYYLTATHGARTGSGDGRLSLTPATAPHRDTIVYDPANPFPSRGGGICCTGNPKDVPGIFDQQDLETRGDVLVYTSDALTEGVSIVGPVRANLYVSTDRKDTDIAAKLLDVDEQGHAWNVADGILRMRYRLGLVASSLLSGSEPYRVEVNLNTVAWYFKPGHRIRVYVTSSNFPMYDRNLNTGGDNVTETQWVTAHNVIQTGPDLRSALALPVLEAKH
jgi:uncharacterized protein